MRRRRRRSSDQVELNLAAMLDMAFQLLAFFILTFRPAAVEVELRMNLPNQTVLAIMDAPESVPSTAASSSTPVVAAIPIFVEATPGGQVSAVRLGQRPIFSGPTSDAKLGLLSRELGLIVSLPGGLMKVQINVAGQLGYEEFMKIVDVCLRQKLANGEPLRDVSYQILPK